MASLTKSLRLYGAMTQRQSLLPRTRTSITVSHRRFRCTNLTPSAHRSLSTSSRLAYPRKDSQDKDSINTEATEYSKSATDDESARQEDAAFNPNITDPQEEKEKAGESTGGANNPLDVSPANPDVSQQRGKQEGGAQNGGSDRERTSGGSSPKKGSKVA